jgi:hypothetical protein
MAFRPRPGAIICREARGYRYSATTSMVPTTLVFSSGRCSAGIQYSRDGVTADLMNVVAVEEVLADPEPGDVPDAGVLDVPVASDGSGVLLVEDRIEDGLLR